MKFDAASTTKFSDVFIRALKDLALARSETPNMSYDKDLLIKELSQANDRENSLFQNSCQRLGLFCAASRSDNQPMWAYYCNNSKGVCFHLEWSEEILKKYKLWPAKVTYTKKSRIHNRAEDFRQLFLELGKKNPKWTLEQLKVFSMTEQFRHQWSLKSTERAVSTKHADWKHEKEIRIISPKPEIQPIVKDILKSVIFTRTDLPEWSSIMMLLYRLYPEVRVFKMDFQHKKPFVKSTEHEMKSVDLE